MDADPEFATVETHNPEEPDYFKLALVRARSRRADLVLATDPDGDRVGCAVRNFRGEYEQLNGNQIGALLLDYLLGRLKERGELPPNGVMIKTIVTGDLGRKIADDYGVKTLETLTGFKYIGEKINRFEKTGEYRFLFGYEESYGSWRGIYARDKDAVGASSDRRDTPITKSGGNLAPGVGSSLSKLRLLSRRAEPDRFAGYEEGGRLNGGF